MNRRLLIRVATGAMVAALATAGAAIAAGHSHDGPKGGGPPGLAAAATYLALSVDTLQADLQKGETLAQVANATSGKSASGLIDALVADAKSHGATDPDLTARITAFVNGTARPFGPGPDLQAALTYLGISADTLRSDLESGKTLAQIADATSGKSAGGLVDALVAADRTRITALVNGQPPEHP